VVIAKELPFGAAGGESQDLFEALRGLRKQLADQEALPAYIVYQIKFCICFASHVPPLSKSLEKSAVSESTRKRNMERIS